MSIETPTDWRGLREVGEITRLTLDALEPSVVPGITTAELDAIAASVLASRGARSAPAMVYGFPGTVLISVNDEIVHGIPGQRRIGRGDLVKLDVTVEKEGYVADAARTVVVDGASAEARRLADCVADALGAALEVSRAGTLVNEIGRTVSRHVRGRGFFVVRGLTGHGIGRTIHEEPSVPNDFDPWQRDMLTEGLVLTIEPMISAGTALSRQDRDGWTIRTRDGSLAAHAEHTVVITRDRPVVLAA